MNHFLLNCGLVGLGALFGVLYSILDNFEIGFYLFIGLIASAIIHYGWMCFVASNEYNRQIEGSVE